MKTIRLACTSTCIALSVLLPLSASADHAVPEGYVAAAGAACSISSDIGLGSRSAEVECLQKHLIEKGFLTLSTHTGYFGEMTKAAVIAWQTKNAVPATGFFGPLSRAAFAGMSNMTDSHAAAPEKMHAQLDVSKWPSVPTVSIVVTPDAMSGYNLEIKTENFTFAPQRASSPALPNEGHAHLMVDGKKIARLYGHWFHIPAEAVAAPGTHEVHVTLNANDHSDLVIDRKVIEARYSLTK